jgi:hypothetical protein
MDRSFTHNGHGWVIPNENGNLAKCGGPAICQSCRKDAELQFNKFREVFTDIAASEEYTEVRSLAAHKEQVMNATNKRNDALCKTALRFALDNLVGVVLDPNLIPELAEVKYDSFYLVSKDKHGRLTITPLAAGQLEHGTVIRTPTLG